MRKSVQTTLILAIGTVFVIMLIAGCEEQNISQKKCRLIADENRQLKQQLVRRDKDIEKQKELLQKCLGEKKNLQELSEENIGNMLGAALGNINEENIKLRQENKKLKAQIEELKN